MIQNKKDYYYYLQADKEALDIKRKSPRPIVDDIWKFQRLLRKLEYTVNCKNGKIAKFYILLLKYRFHKFSRLLGFDIPINVFGPGLSIAHRGTIVVNGGARVGANCRIHASVNIGTGKDTSTTLVPTLGNNVYIGPGAKIFGKIEVGDNVAIGANSVVNKSFESNVTIAGSPAKIINHKGSKDLLFRYETLKEKE
ncbi:serine O-acetyltransferase [Neobacillus cucumis]|uniref:serine O-acetyltransferase n=1 Tax=Neobacillus cucumis TaxID=1740721 RepID=UPI00203BDDD5|nr:serine O-acetyltransferase [Neobacillus cucumis]MCM3729099.1 serine O-acetyltransferase [Neobacillus cucumis]